MDQSAPFLPPELIEETLDHLLSSFSTLSIPSRLGAVQEILLGLSTVNHHFHRRVKREVLRIFPLSNSRHHCEYLKQLLEKHEYEIEGLQFIHQPKDALRHSYSESVILLAHALPLCSSLKKLELDMSSAFREGLPTLPNDFFRYLDTLEVLKIANVVITTDEDGLLLPSSLKSLALDKVQYTSHMYFRGSSLQELNITKSANWSIHKAITPNLRTLEISLDQFIVQRVVTLFRIELLTSLDHLHIDLGSIAEDIGHELLDQLDTADIFLESFNDLPHPLKTLRITYGSKQLRKDILMEMVVAIADSKPSSSMSHLRRLELVGDNPVTARDAFEWTKIYLEESGRSNIEVVWVEAGTPFGGWWDRG